MLILCSIIISTIISGGSYIVGVKQPDIDESCRTAMSADLSPFGNPRVPFSVKFEF